jgi:RNA polymerase sigma-70 factor, ECF subfamily
MIVDQVAFIKVIEENQAILNKICYGYATNSEDRFDLKQEILIQLWKAYPKFKGKSQISTWIYRIALNTAISNYRKSIKKVHQCEISTEPYKLPENDNGFEQDEQLEQLYYLIYQLNELERAIILLYLDDLKYKEIAEIIGISETNVATKINRVKSKLKSQFNN